MPGTESDSMYVVNYEISASANFFFLLNTQILSFLCLRILKSVSRVITIANKRKQVKLHRRIFVAYRYIRLESFKALGGCL